MIMNMRNFSRVALAILLLLSPVYGEVVTLGKYPARILPEQEGTLAFSVSGVVSDLLLTENGRAEKGQVVAVMNKEKTEEEREDMELQLARERLNKRDEMRKLEAQRSKLNFYVKLSARERVYAKDYAPNQDGEVPEDTLQDIEERIGLLKKELETLERRRRDEFKEKHENLTLRMPFTGRLQYDFVLPEEPGKPFEYSFSAGRNFATACDDSAFYIAIEIVDAALGLLPPDAFSASVKLPEGRQLRGTYSHRRVEQSGGGQSDKLIYFFKLDEQDHDTAYSMRGSRAEAILQFTASGDDVERVSKSALLAHPSAGDCESWEDLVGRAYPDHVILVVGERELLLRKKAPVPVTGS